MEFLEDGNTTQSFETAIAIAQPVAVTAPITLTPEGLMAQIERKAALRRIMVNFMKSEMVEGHDYYSFKEGDKPALTQDGAYKIINLFDGITGQPNIEKLHEGGHLSVEVAIDVFNPNGVRIATGNGSATTKESKHAGRWVYENEIPGGTDKDSLEFKEFQKKNGSGSFRKYLVPNKDIFDVHNTVLKMAVKRATVAAARKMPFVSDLFAPEGAGDNNGNKQQVRTAANSGRQQSAPAPKFSPKVTTVLGLVKMLTENHGVEMADLEGFLPEGVESFEKLEDVQAVAITEDLKVILRSKTAAK